MQGKVKAVADAVWARLSGSFSKDVLHSQHLSVFVQILRAGKASKGAHSRPRQVESTWSEAGPRTPVGARLSSSVVCYCEPLRCAVRQQPSQQNCAHGLPPACMPGLTSCMLCSSAAAGLRGRGHHRAGSLPVPRPLACARGPPRRALPGTLPGPSLRAWALVGRSRFPGCLSTGRPGSLLLWRPPATLPLFFHQRYHVLASAP